MKPSRRGLPAIALVLSCTCLLLPSASVIIDDPFEETALNPNIWSEIISNGLSFDQDGQGRSVTIEEGMLVLIQGATDAGGAVVSKPFTVKPGETLQIHKRTRLRFANNYFRGLTALLDAESRGPILQTHYLNYSSGFTANYFALGTYTSDAQLLPVWEEWFEETITYTPETGRATLQINGGPVVEFYRERFVNDDTYRVALTPYGWFTGHSHEIDSIRVETIPSDSDQDGLPDAWEWNIINLDPEDSLDSLAALLPEGDLDNDGLNHLEEFIHETNPLKMDSDDDFFSDGFEISQGWNPLEAGTLETDYAGEIIRSIQRSSEYQERTGLWTSDSIQEIALDDLIIEVAPGAAEVRIEFPLEVSDTLGNWTKVPEDQRPVWVDSMINGTPTRFYRIRFHSSEEPILLKQGLIVHLPMDGDLRDASGHGYNGIPDGDVNGAGSTLTADRFGQTDSAYLLYNTQYASIQIPNFPNNYQQISEMTISVWVQINENYTDNRYIAGNFYWGNRHGWGLKLSPTGGFLFEAYIDKDDEFGNPFSWLGAVSNIVPQLGEWHHLAGQFSNGEGGTIVRVFVDGTLATAQTLPGSYPYRDGNRFGLGGDGAREQILTDARVDDLRIYDRLLTTKEISALANEVITTQVAP